MSLWSHACNHAVYGKNSLAGCKQAVENGFTGIEVDAQYHNGQFYLHHDHWDMSNETLEQLFQFNLTANLYVDLKTSDVDSIGKLVGLVSHFRHRLIVEVYDQKMVLPLQNANITVARLGSFNTVEPWQYILYGVKTPCATWNLDMLCFNDMFFADGGDIVLTDFYRPWHCDLYFPGRWSLWACIIIIALALILLTYCIVDSFVRRLHALFIHSRVAYTLVSCV